MGFAEIIQLAKNRQSLAETNNLLRQQNKLLAEIRGLLEKRV